MDHTDHGRPKTTPSSNSDLMSSAKILADAAKSALSHESDKIDKAKVAGATADVLAAAKRYGKLEEKSFGKYVDKAETYLHSYHSSSSSPAPAASTTTSHGGGGSGGYGEYMKLAQGLLKKGSQDGDGGHSGGGSGDYIKLAQGFLKKH